MLRTYGVATVHTGTFDEQRLRLERKDRPTTPGLLRSQWQSWDPGTDSEAYDWILESFEDFAATFGGVPHVRQIVFYKMKFELDTSGVAVEKPEVGAQYGAGELVIYEATTTRRSPLPIGRSVQSGRYPPVGIVVTGISGQTPGAPLPVPTQAQNVTRPIVHELGHGLEEAVRVRFSTMLDEYKHQVGWTATDPAELYDIGVPAVKRAIVAGAPPPVDAHIERDHWNDPKWREQPLSIYMLEDPWEDFSEAITAFVDSPGLLQARSPHRYEFLERRRSDWAPLLRPVKRPGDYPLPEGDTRPA